MKFSKKRGPPSCIIILFPLFFYSSRVTLERLEEHPDQALRDEEAEFRQDCSFIADEFQHASDSVDRYNHLEILS
jgi:hypothetical protein